MTDQKVKEEKQNINNIVLSIWLMAYRDPSLYSVTTKSRIWQSDDALLLSSELENP
jgi:hypothetical protein